jgi:hypothetical protein
VPDYSKLAAISSMNSRPNKLTAKTLKMSNAGKGIKHFSSKKALYSDLGLREPQPIHRPKLVEKRPISPQKNTKNAKKGTEG